MIRRTAQYLWAAKVQFAKYATVGGVGVILDFSTLILLKEMAGFTPVIATMINQLIVLSFNFTLNKLWSFQNKEIPYAQMVRYGLLAGWNYLFSVGMMYLFHDLFGIHYLLVRGGSIAVMVSWNFLLYKHWVYRAQVSRE